MHAGRPSNSPWKPEKMQSCGSKEKILSVLMETKSPQPQLLFYLFIFINPFLPCTLTTAGLIATPGCFPQVSIRPPLVPSNNCKHRDVYTALLPAQRIPVGCRRSSSRRARAATLLLLHQHRCPNSMSIIPFLND